MDYLFHEGQIPSGYPLAFEESLFNREDHRTLQSESGWHSFFVLETSTKTINASIHFHLNSSSARSPFRSPFGSVECNDGVPEVLLFDFMKFVFKQLASKGIKEIAIKHYPQIYNKRVSLILKSFFETEKFNIVLSEVSSILHINQERAIAQFHRSEKRKLKKAEASGSLFKEIPLDQLQTVYSFINECRTKKNYALSMSFDDLKSTVNKIPDKFFLFGVFLEDKLIAAAITIQVKSKILYDFYHDHDSAFDELSPVVKLVSGIYDFCQVKTIEMLDLGTSSIGEEINSPLLHFKTLLGGKPSPKETFQKILV